MNAVVSVWDSGTEYHTDDPTIAKADIPAIIAEVKAVQELWGRNVEACGYFSECGTDPGDVHTFRLENVSPKPGTFALHDDDCLFLAELMDQRMLLGLWHSHPNGKRTPSDEDWAGHPHGIPMYIVSCEGDGDYMITRFTDDDRPGRQQFDDD